jgi:hypothetical protein
LVREEEVRRNSATIRFVPEGVWSATELQTFCSSVSAIYNIFFILNLHRKEIVKEIANDFMDYFRNYYRGILDSSNKQDILSMFSLEILQGLDEFINDYDKIVIEHAEFGSPDDFTFTGGDVETASETKDYFKGKYKIKKRITQSEIDYGLKNLLYRAVDTATNNIMTLVFKGKLRNISENIEYRPASNF